MIWDKDPKLVESIVQYRDDIGIPGRTLKKAVLRFDRLLHCFRKHMGSISEEISVLFVKQVQFVGSVIGDKLIAPVEEWFKALGTWLIPRDQSEVRSFAGFI